jgi:aerobic carbon-monoxide dehydrogenase medium subunit
MIPAAFDYIAVKSVPDAVAELVKHGDEAKLLAGGHSLIPLMKLRLATPSFVVDIGPVKDLNYIRRSDGEIAIGALTTHHDIEFSDLVKAQLPVLASAAGQIGDPQVRNRGTIGGAAAHADPSGDFPACLRALDAEFEAAGPRGRRVIKAKDFFVDTFTTALQPDEVLTEIRVPVPPADTRGTYLKFSRRSQDWAIVAVAAQVTIKDRKFQDVRIGLTSMGGTPVRATAVEEALRGERADENTIRAAAEKAAVGTNPPADLNGSPDYRRHLATVLTRRALEEVALK